jgi:hypothetical protein
LDIELNNEEKTVKTIRVICQKICDEKKLDSVKCGVAAIIEHGAAPRGPAEKRHHPVS